MYLIEKLDTVSIKVLFAFALMQCILKIMCIWLQLSYITLFCTIHYVFFISDNFCDKYFPKLFVKNDDRKSIITFVLLIEIL